eukprot:6904941-Karenia_brevis.AAC.1
MAAEGDQVVARWDLTSHAGTMVKAGETGKITKVEEESGDILVDFKNLSMVTRFSASQRSGLPKVFDKE